MTVGESGHGARFAASPVAAGGTPSSTWLGWGREFPELALDDCPGLLLVAPHPDDETLGFGATAALLWARGVEVKVVSVSDGGALPGLSPLERVWLERDRRAELVRATKALGLEQPNFLGLPDGELSAHEARLTELLVELLEAGPPGAWCAATWRGDGHPDHEATGRAAAAASARTGATLLEYPVWMWHWAQPDDEDVPWQRMVTMPVDPVASARKRAAAKSFQTQTASRPGVEPVLPPAVFQRLLRLGEVAFR